MDYKNNYPLSLILDIIENIGIKKVFTKIDLRWGYNNIWVKKKDLVLKEEKVYMPKDKILRAEIIWLHHDIPVVGHGGK